MSIFRWPLLFAVSWGGVLGSGWQLAVRHDLGTWWLRVPIAYAIGYAIIRVTGWWIGRILRRAAIGHMPLGRIGVRTSDGRMWHPSDVAFVLVGEPYSPQLTTPKDSA